MRLIFILFLSLLVSQSAFADKTGYKIDLGIKDYPGEEVILASYYGNSNLIVDTFPKSKNGTFIMKGDEQLDGGVYLVIMPPANKFFEIIIDKEQIFSIQCDTLDFIKSMKIKGSEENKIFYEYLNFISKKRDEAGKIGEELKSAKTDEDKEKIQKKRDALDDEVSEYFNSISEKYPRSLNNNIIKAAQPVKMPDELQKEGADDGARYLYYKTHYFDNLDLTDDRMLRTNFLFKRIEYYMNKLTVQTPDSIAVSVDRILSPMKKDGDMFKYYLVHFLNHFAKSKVVGMDAVYVSIFNNYYAKGLAPWTDKETYKKIEENVKSLEPILIGKTAPDFRMKKRDGTPLTLSEVKSEYTILYFWDADCGHCKKASPKMKEFYSKFKNKNVQILAVCTEVGEDVKKCWDTIDEREYEWMNLVDPFMQSRYKTNYYIKSTPQIFILDKDKKIIMKRIGAEQLDEVMDKIIEREQKELDKKKEK